MMAFAPLFDPTQQFMARSGVPLAGRLLYVYRNTSQELATLKNVAGTTIANPVTLDADGRAAGGVFVSNASTYTLVVKDAYEATQWTIAGMSPLGGGSGGGSTVSITPTLSSGTKIADYSIDGETGSLFAPNGGGSSEIIRKIHSLGIGYDKALEGINGGDVYIDSTIITKKKIELPFVDKRLYPNDPYNFFKVSIVDLCFYLGAGSSSITPGDVWDLGLYYEKYDMDVQSVTTSNRVATIPFKWSTNGFTFGASASFIMDLSTYDWEHAKPVLSIYLGNKASILTANADTLKMNGYLEACYNYV